MPRPITFRWHLSPHNAAQHALEQEIVTEDGFGSNSLCPHKTTGLPPDPNAE